MESYGTDDARFDRALELCRRLREFADEKRRLAGAEDVPDENAGGAEKGSGGEIDSVVKELTSLIERAGRSDADPAAVEKFRAEIAATIATIDEAARTVREERDVIRAKQSEERTRGAAIRSYQALNVS